MKITDLLAYQRLISKFDDGTFTHGTYTSTDYSKDFTAYIKSHLGTKFDRDFFKDYIWSKPSALESQDNCFSYMPLEYIDEEMVSEAMYQAVNRRYVDRRGDFSDWFYSVAERKPEVLTQELWTLAARCFASKGSDGKNRILEMTPKQYRSEEYYFAMCLSCDTPVMEDFPKDVLTNNLLVSILNENAENIKCFSADALEKEVHIAGRKGTYKYWQAAILLNGYAARYIPLNDERVEFFLAHYDKDSGAYRYGFQDKYKRYKKLKTQQNHPTPDSNKAIDEANLAIDLAMSTGSLDAAVNITSAVASASINRTERLPIEYIGRVPKKYCKKYDQEEYLIEIYKKLGIKVQGECGDGFYYSVILPKNISIEKISEDRYQVNNSGTKILTYYDRGPFYDRDVEVDKIFITL